MRSLFVSVAVLCIAAGAANASVFTENTNHATASRFTADLNFHATAKLGFGVSVWYEKLDISDYATINLAGTQNPRIDYLGELSTGYGNRPYNGSTGMVRLIFTF